MQVPLTIAQKLAAVYDMEYRYLWLAYVQTQAISIVDTQDGFISFVFTDDSALHVQGDGSFFQVES